MIKKAEKPQNKKISAGEVLRAIRKIRGFSAEEIAEKIKINPQTIYGYEQGKYMPKIQNTNNLFGFLKIDYYIFHRTISEHATDDPKEIAQLIIDECRTENAKNIRKPEKIFAGKVLRAIREHWNLSCPEISGRFDISTPVIYDYEQGRCFPRGIKARAIEDALKIKLKIFKRLLVCNPDADPQELARKIIDESQEDRNPADPEQYRKIYCGKVLKSVRLIRGIYGPEIQDKLGISTNSLYDYERGRSFPKAEYADRLFGYLGIDQKIFRDICEVNFSMGVPVDQTAKMILNGKAPERKTEEAEDVPDEYDAMIVSAVKCGLKNLTEAEKTILFRMIVNFTTQPVKKAYFHE